MRKKHQQQQQQSRPRNADHLPLNGRISPPPVRGRRNERVQTDKFLEELAINPYETDVACQTDLYLERPLTPPFVPTKTGIDVGVQVDVEAEKFDIDRELELVIDDCVARAVVEVAQDRVDEENNKSSELSPRDAVNTPGKEKRTSAANILQGYVADLLPGILNSIKSIREADNNAELKKQLAPWLAQEISQEVGQIIDSRELLKELVKEILQERAELYVAMSGDNRVAAKKINLFEDDTFDSQLEKGAPKPQFPEKIENVLSRNVEILEQLERQAQSVKMKPMAIVSKSSTTTSDQVTSLESDEVASEENNRMNQDARDNTIEEQSEVEMGEEDVGEEALDILESQIIGEGKEEEENVDGNVDSQENQETTSGEQESVEPNFNIEITPKLPSIAVEDQQEMGPEGESGEEGKESDRISNDLEAQPEEVHEEVIKAPVIQLMNETLKKVSDEIIEGDDDDQDETLPKVDDQLKEDDPEIEKHSVKEEENDHESSSFEAADEKTPKNVNIEVERDHKEEERVETPLIVATTVEQQYASKEDMKTEEDDTIEIDNLDKEEDQADSPIEEIDTKEEKKGHEEEQKEPIIQPESIKTEPSDEIDDSKDVPVEEGPEPILVTENSPSNDGEETSGVVVLPVEIKDDSVMEETTHHSRTPSNEESSVRQSSAEVASEFNIQSPKIEKVNQENETPGTAHQKDLKPEENPEIIISSSPSMEDNKDSFQTPSIKSARVETPDLDFMSYPDDELLDLMDDIMLQKQKASQETSQMSSPTAKSETNTLNESEKETTFEIIEGAEVLTIKSSRRASLYEEPEGVQFAAEDNPLPEDPEMEGMVEVIEVCTKRIVSNLTSPASETEDEETKKTPSANNETEKCPSTINEAAISPTDNNLNKETTPPEIAEEKEETKDNKTEPEVIIKDSTPKATAHCSPLKAPSSAEEVLSPHNTPPKRDIKTPSAPPLEIPSEKEREMDLIENELPPKTPQIQKVPQSSPKSLPEQAPSPAAAHPISCEDMDLYRPETSESSKPDVLAVVNYKQVSFETGGRESISTTTSPFAFKVDEQDNVSLLNAFCCDLNEEHAATETAQEEESSSPKPIKMIGFDEGERAALVSFVDDIEQTAKSIVQSPMAATSFIYESAEQRINQVAEELDGTKLEMESKAEEIRKEMSDFVEGIQKEAEFVLSKPIRMAEDLAKEAEEVVTKVESIIIEEAAEATKTLEQQLDNHQLEVSSNQGRDEVDNNSSSLTLQPPQAHNNDDSEMEMDSLEVTTDHHLEEKDDNDDVVMDCDSMDGPNSLASSAEEVMVKAVNLIDEELGKSITPPQLVHVESLNHTESETDTTATEVTRKEGVDEKITGTVSDKKEEIPDEDKDEEFILITKDGKL